MLIKTTGRTVSCVRNPRDQVTGRDRCGAIIVLSAVVLTMVIVLVALGINLGYVAMTKSQLQNAADAASLAAANELGKGLGLGATSSVSQTQQTADSAAVDVAAKNRNGNILSTVVVPSRDIKFGTLSWSSSQNTWVKTWGTTPQNLVSVTAPRSVSSSGGDGPLPTLFGSVLTPTQVGLSARASAGLLPGVGVKLSDSSQIADILPIAIDITSWSAYMAGSGSDNYYYDPDTNTVRAGSDGIKELDIYPYDTGLPGNRGTVDIGTTNNSTANLQRQILYGLNNSDLAMYGGSLRTDQSGVHFAGNPGLSGSIKSSLTATIGRPRLAPVFTSATGNGAKADYAISKFVGVRVIYVRLTGAAKKVLIQPAAYVSSQVIRGKIDVGPDSYWTKPVIVE